MLPIAWRLSGPDGETIMARVYFSENVENFIASLGNLEADVLSDLFVISNAGPNDLSWCEQLKDGIWEYRRPIGSARYAYLLFVHHQESNSYVILHGFRGDIGGTTRADLKIAQRRRKGLQ
jgi:phage-related protein